MRFDRQFPAGGSFTEFADMRAAQESLDEDLAGFDEMDEVNGPGSAELLDDGSLEFEFAYHLGDEATLKAERATLSAAC